MEAANSTKTMVIDTNQNIILSQKTLIFFNTGVWTSDLPRKLILSIKHTYRETICCHNGWRYWQQFSWLLYCGIWYHVSWYSSTLLTEKALPSSACTSVPNYMMWYIGVADGRMPSLHGVRSVTFASHLAVCFMESQCPIVSTDAYLDISRILV